MVKNIIITLTMSISVGLIHAKQIMFRIGPVRIHITSKDITTINAQTSVHLAPCHYQSSVHYKNNNLANIVNATLHDGHAWTQLSKEGSIPVILSCNDTSKIIIHDLMDDCCNLLDQKYWFGAMRRLKWHYLHLLDSANQLKATSIALPVLCQGASKGDLSDDNITDIPFVAITDWIVEHMSKKTPISFTDIYLVVDAQEQECFAMLIQKAKNYVALIASLSKKVWAIDK